MSGNQSEGGFFENVLMVLGGISGAVFGYDNGEWIGLFVGALILGGIGKVVGTAADWTLKMIALIIILLINRAVRHFIWNIIAAAFE